MKLSVPFLALAVTLSAAAPPSLGWNAHGHRLVTHLAMDRFADTAPAWLLTDEARTRVAYESNECDRWKSTPTPAINHVNRPDHFIDTEQLAPMGMSLAALPPLRRTYLEQMVLARHADPASAPDGYDPAHDPARAYTYPGFLPYAILEHYEKLRASFTEVRVLETLEGPGRPAQLAQAHANVIYHMGMLAHFVGDGAQPLHTTEHFNGWTGDNPHGYTTDKGFHAFIDGGALDLLGIDYTVLAPEIAATPAPRVDPANPWPAITRYLGETFATVEPLYELDRDGGLRESAGREFLSTRLQTGAAMLGALYAAAWEVSAPTKKQAENFVKYDDFRPEREPFLSPLTARTAGDDL